MDDTQTVMAAFRAGLDKLGEGSDGLVIDGPDGLREVIACSRGLEGLLAGLPPDHYLRDAVARELARRGPAPVTGTGTGGHPPLAASGG